MKIHVLAGLLIGILPFAAWADCELDKKTITINNCPDDAKQFLQRMATCSYFAGEHTGGSSPERDREVNEEFKKWRCLDTDRKGNEKEFWQIIEKYRNAGSYTIYVAVLDTLQQIDPEFILRIAEKTRCDTKSN